MKEETYTFKKELEIEKKVLKVEGAMAQEGMPLTEEIKNNVRSILLRKTTAERECQKVIEKYRVANGREI